MEQTPLRGRRDNTALNTGATEPNADSLPPVGSSPFGFPFGRGIVQLKGREVRCDRARRD